MLEGKRIILGITGSIAAYKSVLLLRLLRQAGAEVKVVTTPSVGEFVGELTLSTLSNQAVFSGLWEEGWSQHVALGTESDLMVIAPATANTIAKMATGICDNALMAVYFAARCPVLVASAMDADMYIHPRTTANLQQLKEDGVTVLPVGQGYLASGLEGLGRMMEPEDIFQAIQQRLSDGLLSGKKVLITAGPTREPIDPVRFITNHSTGKMGYALADVAQQLGADVTLVSGPVTLQAPSGVHLVPVERAAEMFEAVKSRAPDQNIIVKAAAVADYTLARTSDQKMKKQTGHLSVDMVRTQDILQYLGDHKPADQILVGFALETNDALENARSKLERKRLDFIVLNTLEDAGAGFGHDTNVVTILDKSGGQQKLPLMSKQQVARAIFEQITGLFPST